MSKLRIFNKILLGVILVLLLILFFTVGIGQIWETISTGSDDGLWFGFIPLGAIIILIIYLILDTRHYKEGKQENKLIRASYWINIIFILTTIILGIIVMWPCWFSVCDGLGEGLAIMGLGIILSGAILVSFIFFLIGISRK